VSDRRKSILKFTCLVFAAVLAYQIAHLVATANPVRHLSIPQVPKLPGGAETNAATSKSAVTNGTNNASGKMQGTNGTKGTNVTQARTNEVRGTNGTNTASAMGAATNSTGTNVASKSVTNVTNVLVEGAITNFSNSNALPIAEEKKTNSALVAGPGKTNEAPKGTNSAATNLSVKTGTNSIATNSVAKNVGGRPDQPGKQPELPPEIKGRVDRITQSEILGQVIHPLPMALLGIAGQEAFLRAANGQTSTLKEGGEFSGMKLLRIGTNRVLVEVEGQKKELTIFSGFGSETLLENKTNDPPSKAKSL
jgi:hypothetical protein